MYSVTPANGDVQPIREHAINYIADLGEEIDPDYYINQWQKFMDTGIGVVFYLRKDGVVVGGIGAIKAPDVFCGKGTLVELFWYVDPKHRKAGILLYKALEEYFYSQIDLKRFCMVHMERSMPEKLKTFYIKQNFRLLETQWVKDKV